MLIDTYKTHSCINCGHDTTLIDTNTAYAVCNEDCRYDLWVEKVSNQYDYSYLEEKYNNNEL